MWKTKDGHQLHQKKDGHPLICITFWFNIKGVFGLEEKL